MCDWAVIKGFIYGKGFGQCIDVEIVGVFFGVICIGAVGIKDAHATEEGLMRALHAVEIVDGAVGSPGGEVALGADMADAVAVSFPTLENVGVVYCKPAEVRGVASPIPIGIGCPFVGVEAVEAVAVLHFPPVTSNVELAKERGVVSGFAQVMGKEDFILGQDIVQAIDAVAGQVFAGPEAGATGRAYRVVDIALVVARAFTGEAVEVGGVYAAYIATTERVPALLIGQDEEDVVGHE